MRDPWNADLVGIEAGDILDQRGFQGRRVVPGLDHRAGQRVDAVLFLGHGQRRSVAILWAWTAILSGLVLFPTYTNRGNAVIPFAVLALGVLLYTFFHPGVRRGGAEVLSTPEDPTP